MNSSRKADAALIDDEWAKGWPVVLAATLAGGVSAFSTHSIGAAMKPLTAEFGWSRTEITTGPFIVSMIGLVMAPLVGVLVDRLGPRRVGQTALWLYALGILLLGFTGPAIWTWYAAYAFLAVVGPAASTLVWAAAVISRFDRNRGMAFGIVIGGVSFFAGFVPIFMAWAIEALGLRQAYALLAAAVIVLAVSPVFFLLHHADDLRRRGRQDRLPAFATHAKVSVQDQGLTLRAAVRSSRFWRLSLILMIAGGVSGFFLVHLQPLLTDAGVSAATAALTVGGIGPIIVVSRLLAGWLMDRVFAPYLLAAILLFPVAACVLLVNLNPSVAVGWAVAMLIGCAMGAEGDAVPFLVSRYFGRRAFASVYGAISASFTLGMGGGPLLGARIFDITGSYRPLMLFACAALALAIVLLLTLGRYPDFARRAEDDPQELRDAEPARA